MECSRNRGGVAYEEETGLGRSHNGFNGRIDFVADSLRLVNHDKHVGAVKPLELVCRLGGQSHGISVFGQLPAGIQHLASQNSSVGAVQAPDLPP